MKTKHRLAAMVSGSLMVLLAAASVQASQAARSAGAEGSAEAVFRAARGYTVRIRTRIETPFVEDEQGSFEGAGFLIDAKRRWILTNAHVVGRSPSDVQIAFAGERFQPAHKLYVDSFADVAVLTVDEIPSGRIAASLDCGDDVHVGEAVGVFGHPLGMYFTGTRGIISNKTDQAGPDLLQTDATIDHGNSGGPVIALCDGRVVGIATAMAGDDKTDRVNFATPMRDVGRILSLLRTGTSPSPPRMECGLLRNEEGSHTMTVAGSYDLDRWPLQPQDHIVSVGNGAESKTLTDLVSALRGCDRSTLTVERNGQRVQVEVRPTLRPLTAARHGVVIDGALIAPLEFDDEVSLSEPVRLIVHSVAPGSAAEALGVRSTDMLQSVDGRTFTDLDSLTAHLQGRSSDAAIQVVLQRWSPSPVRLFDYHLRELPGADVHRVGPEPTTIAAKQP